MLSETKHLSLSLKVNSVKDLSERFFATLRMTDLNGRLIKRLLRGVYPELDSKLKSGPGYTGWVSATSRGQTISFLPFCHWVTSSGWAVCRPVFASIAYGP